MISRIHLRSIFYFNFCIEVSLICNVALVSDVQYSGSVTDVYVSILFSDSFPLHIVTKY